MKTLLEVLSALSDFVAVATEWAESATQAELETFTQIYPPMEEQPKAEITPETEPIEEVTLPEVRAVLANKSRAGFTEEVKQLLMKHGAEKLSGIAESEYAALLKEAEHLGS
ncbi:hypothetical protein [Ruminococcus sp.]|uniref:hypothetical protein n=1 Tax=Ruminococcus sp. TaxID=41978 RepID=UPI003433394D